MPEAHLRGAVIVEPDVLYAQFSVIKDPFVDKWDFFALQPRHHAQIEALLLFASKLDLGGELGSRNAEIDGDQLSSAAAVSALAGRESYGCRKSAHIEKESRDEG